MRNEFARLAARQGRQSLELGQTRDAAWLALWSVDQAPTEGLGWALLARIVLEATEDPLGTVATRYALSLEVPEPERPLIERLHRIDLWTRGLLDHSSGESILSLTAFDDPNAFAASPRFDGWLNSQLKEFGDIEQCATAVYRMVAAFSDAYVVPDTDDNPLRVNDWEPTDAYRSWVDADPLEAVTDVPPAEPETDEQKAKVQLLSDYRIEQEISELGAQGSFQLARDRAVLWTHLRRGRIKPLAMLIRVLHAGGWTKERDEAVAELVGCETRDLNALEEARLVLGELELWNAQLQILDQMDAIAPGHAVILANRGVARMQIGRTADGAADLERALEADPDCGPALANLGLHRMREDEYVAARGLLERAVQVAPEQAQVRVYLAACKNNQSDRAGAIAELKRALELEPTHPQAIQLLAELEARGPLPMD